MIQANLRLVVKIAKVYSNPGMTLGDLVAEGNLGLLRAVEEFDPDAGVRFSTYAAWWIKQAIKRAMINAGQPIHIPAYLVKLISKWRQAARLMEAQAGRPPTVEEMGKRLRIGPKKAEIIYHGLAAVNAPSQMASDESQTISEVVVDDEAPPDQGLLDAGNAPFVRVLLDHLDERQRKILEALRPGRLRGPAAHVQADRRHDRPDPRTRAATRKRGPREAQGTAGRGVRQ